MSREFYTITADDVGKVSHKIHGRTWLASSWIGQVLPGDVGKRVYLVGDVLQVENDEQRDQRVGKQLHWTKSLNSLNEAKWVANIPLTKRSRLPSPLQARVTTHVIPGVERYHLVLNWPGVRSDPLVSLLANDFIGAEAALRDQLILYGLFPYIDAEWFAL